MGRGRRGRREDNRSSEAEGDPLECPMLLGLCERPKAEACNVGEEHEDDSEYSEDDVPEVVGGNACPDTSGQSGTDIEKESSDDACAEELAKLMREAGELLKMNPTNQKDLLAYMEYLEDERAKCR